MKILVNGKQAVLKEGSSFEYRSENPLFTDAEDYSLEIEFPMKDCPENILIFGALHVKGVDISNITYVTEIITSSFDKKGFLVVTEVNEICIKGQFLEGISMQKFNADVVDLYIDELEYSLPEGSSYEGWSELVVYDKNEDKFFRPDGTGYSYYYWHVKLKHLVEMIASIIGLGFDTADLESIPMYSRILVANTDNSLAARHVEGQGIWVYEYFMNLKESLPHWTVKRFFNEVGNFFGCLTIIDTANNTVSFKKRVSYVNSGSRISISPLDEYCVEIGDVEDNSYSLKKKYKLSDECNEGGYNMCSWFIKELSKGNIGVDDYTFQGIAALMEGFAIQIRNNSDTPSDANRVMKVGNLYVVYTDWEDRQDIDPDNDKHELFIKYEVINQFGDLTEGDELGIVPAPLEIKRQTPGKGQITHTGGTYGPEDHYRPYKVPVLEIAGVRYMKGFLNPKAMKDILSGGENGLRYKYDKLYVVLSNAAWDDRGYNINVRKYEADAGETYAAETIAATGKDVPTYYGAMREYEYTLAPNDPSIAQNMDNLPIDETKLYRYKFISKTLPDPKSIYVIKGKEYACLRLTAHFTVDGMSELIEGEFYEIVG